MKKEVFLIAISASIAIAANNQADLKLINADVAHNAGITGKGINIAVIDGPAKTDLPSLQGQIKEQKYSSYPNSSRPYEPNFSADTHGSHVTSIIVGKYQGIDKPYGVAYDSKSYNIQRSGSTTAGKGDPVYPEIKNYFKNNNVVAINNSWNSSNYPLSKNAGFDYMDKDLGFGVQRWLAEATKNNTIAKELMDISKDNQAVVVVSAGNEGANSPGLYAVLRSLDEGLQTWITAGAVNAAKITTENGKLKVKGSSVWEFKQWFCWNF